MINIELCGNRKVYDGMLMSLLSIIKNTNEELNVYVLTMDLHELDERFVPITDEQIETLNKVVKTKNELSKVQKIDITKIFEIRYDDIDVNCHANNGNYIIWAFEPLDFEFKSSHKLKILDIQFKKEIKFGQKVLSQIEFKDENTTVHVIKNAETNEDLCLLEALWTENK